LGEGLPNPDCKKKFVTKCYMQTDHSAYTVRRNVSEEAGIHKAHFVSEQKSRAIHSLKVQLRGMCPVKWVSARVQRGEGGSRFLVFK